MDLDPLYALIKKYEGFSAKPYLCPAGVWTIGYGHTGVGITKNTKPITQEVAELLMQDDANKFVTAVLVLSPILANKPDKLCALADFCYNLGTGRYKASTLKRRVDEGNWEAAAIELNKWVWGGGRKLPGLVLRRIEEGKLLTLGD